MEGAFPGRTETHFLGLVVAAPETVFPDCPVPVFCGLLALAGTVRIQSAVREVTVIDFRRTPGRTVQASFPDGLPPVQVDNLGAIAGHNGCFHSFDLHCWAREKSQSETDCLS